MYLYVCIQNGREIEMPDRVYDYAVALRDDWARKINEAQQHIEAMRKELRAVEAFLEQYAQFAANSQGQTVDASDHSSTPKPRLVGIPTFDSAPTRLRNSKKEEVARVAREILAEEDKPIARKELLKAVTERGIIVSGKDPEMVLSTMMWRMQNEFIRLPRWGLRTVLMPRLDTIRLFCIPATMSILRWSNASSPERCRGPMNNS
jgi:HB1, ASXL, restriction endonuclease HTH domain